MLEISKVDADRKLVGYKNVGVNMKLGASLSMNQN
jgi:hypothetical protein